MTNSRAPIALLAAALAIALSIALWQTMLAHAALASQDTARRELHASEILRIDAQHETATAEERAADIAKRIEDRRGHDTSAQTRMASTRALSGGALVREQTAESLRARPEIMAAAREATTRRIRWQYGPLIARLGLNAAQEAQFEALLIQRDGITVDNYQIQPVDSAGQRAATFDLQQLLGDAGYAQLTDYTKTLSVRWEVGQIAANLSQVEPLSPDVAEKLVQLGAAAIKAKIDEAQKSGATGFGFSRDEVMLPAAQSLLTPRQFEAFKLLVEQETGRKVAGS